jgi:hypothetical protein
VLVVEGKNKKGCTVASLSSRGGQVGAILGTLKRRRGWARVSTTHGARAAWRARREGPSERRLQSMGGAGVSVEREERASHSGCWLLGRCAEKETGRVQEE